MTNQNVAYTSKYLVAKEDGGYRFRFVCGLCSRNYTTALISGESEDDALRAAENEARPYFNGCHKCGRWICDEHYNKDEMVCTECALSLGGEETTESGDFRTKPRKHIRNIAAAACIVAVVGAGTINAIDGKSGQLSLGEDHTPLAALPSVQTDETAKPYTGAAPAVLTAEGVMIPNMESVTIPAGTADVRILLFNPADNDYSLAFEVAVDGETLYASGLVEPGMCVEDITLSKRLARGEYKAILKVRIYGQESNSETGETGVEFSLLVQDTT